MLICQDLSAGYLQGKRRIKVLVEVNFSLAAEAVAIVGPSGSGKSTLLRVIAGLQKGDGGVITADASSFDVRRQTSGRRGIALIHQDYQLVPFLTVAENVQLAAELSESTHTTTDRATALIAEVGLTGCDDRLPATLSGGQQQRAAIARALASAPSVLLADEPTGALDAVNSAMIADILCALPEQQGVSVLVASHDAQVYGKMHRVLSIADGTVNEVAK